MQCQKKVTAVLNYLLQQEPRKLSEIVTTLPKMGVGRQVTRITWNIQDRTHQVKPFYWTITKVVTDQVRSLYRLVLLILQRLVSRIWKTLRYGVCSVHAVSLKRKTVIKDAVREVLDYNRTHSFLLEIVTNESQG